MILAYDNEVFNATISMTNEAPLFPRTNLKDSRLSRYTGVLGTETRITFNVNAQAQMVAIAGHNLTTSATVKIEGNATNDWTSPAFSETITYNEDMLVNIFAPATYQYWSISIDDSTNTEDLKIGGVFLGDYVKLQNTFAHTVTDRLIDTTTRSVSLSGQVYTDVNHDYYEYDLHFPKLTLSDVNETKQAMRFTKKEPLYIILDATSFIEFSGLYCTIDDLQYSRVFDDFYTTDISLRQAK